MKIRGALKRFVTYMAVERHCSPGTAIAYCRDIQRFEREASTSLAKAKPKRIRRWLVAMMEDGSNQPQSVHRKIAALTACCKWMVREGIRSKNPMERIEKPKADKRLAPCARRDEVDALLAVTVTRRNPSHELRDRAMLQLLYGSGLRRAEVCSIDVGHLDAGDTLRIVGKGSKERIVFLTPSTLVAVASYLETRKISQASDPLFLTARGRRMSPRQLWLVFRQYADKAGIRREVHPHSLRHSFATELLEGGADIMTVKELLGHSSVATTQGYLNMSKGHIRASWEKARLARLPANLPQIAETTPDPSPTIDFQECG
jgi:integrase/recombinase XerD